MSETAAAPVVRPLSVQDAGRWTAFIAGRGDAVFYHTLVWRDFVQAVFRQQPYYLLCERDAAITGVLPLFLVRFPLLGSKLLSMPYDVGAGGPLVADAASAAALVAQAMTLARELRVDYLQLRCPADIPALAPLGLAESRPVILSEIVLDDEQAVLGRIEKDHRKAIRKAQNRGVVVREAACMADCMRFFQVYLQVFLDFGTPPYGRDYFERLWQDLAPGGHARLLLAEVDGNCVGGLLMFAFGRNLTSKFAAVLPDAVPLRAYPALYWRAMEIGLQENYSRLSWGTSSRDQTGLIEFKERWGAQSSAPALYDLAVNGHAPDLGKYYDSAGLAQRLWKRLPLSWTPRLGGWLNRWYC